MYWFAWRCIESNEQLMTIIQNMKVHHTIYIYIFIKNVLKLMKNWCNSSKYMKHNIKGIYVHQNCVEINEKLTNIINIYEHLYKIYILLWNMCWNQWKTNGNHQNMCNILKMYICSWKLYWNQWKANGTHQNIWKFIQNDLNFYPKYIDVWE